MLWLFWLLVWFCYCVTCIRGIVVSFALFNCCVLPVGCFVDSLGVCLVFVVLLCAVVLCLLVVYLCFDLLDLIYLGLVGYVVFVCCGLLLLCARLYCCFGDCFIVGCLLVVACAFCLLCV